MLSAPNPNHRTAHRDQIAAVLAMRLVHCFDHLIVVNPSPMEALCRVVAIALAEPGAAPQGAIAVVQITQQPLQVPPRSQVRLDPPSAAYAAISPYFGSSWVTVKSYPSAK